MKKSQIITAFEKMGLDPRAVQLDYAQQVADTLEMTGKVSLLHAETGVGKTLGYLVPAAALLAKSKGDHQVIIATQSHALLNQLSDKDAPRICHMAQTLFGRTLTIGTLLGKANYLDPARVDEALADRQLTEEDKRMVTVLKAWPNTIAEYVDVYGELPLELTPGKICMTDTSYNPAYDERRKTVLASDIIITTHAMLAVDMLLNGKILHSEEVRTHLIIDEADMLVSLLKDMQVRRLNLRQVAHDLNGVMTPAQKRRFTALMEKVTVTSNRSAAVWSDAADEIAEETLLFLGTVIANMDEPPESLRTLDYLRGQGELGLGVSTVREEPAIISVDFWATKRFAGYIARHSAGCIMTSGTLSYTAEKDKGTRWLRSELGIDAEKNLGELAMFAPTKFGKLSLTLAGQHYPRIFIDDEEDEVKLNPDWIDATAAHIHSLRGNVVVLAGSHKEAEKIEKALIAMDEGRCLLRHQRGDKLAVSLNEFKLHGGILITPAGHVGLDIRRDNGKLGFDELVITRICFSPPKLETLKAMAEYHKTRTSSREDVLKRLQAHAYITSLGDAIRKGRQSIGRGIRAEHDNIHVSILDPRFPLFAQFGGHYRSLVNIIPTRFQAAHRQAQIVGTAGTAGTAGTTDQTITQLEGVF